MYGFAPYGEYGYGDALINISLLSADSQSATPGQMIIMYDIDTSPIGGTDIWYLCSGTVDGLLPVWKGNTYAAFPIMATGFEWSGRGALPRPKMTLANAAGLMTGAVIQYNDLLGAKVTRWKTLTKYLDNQPLADSETHYLPDIYYIDRKSAHTKTMIEFELAAALDQQGVMLPARQVIRDSCTNTYRHYDFVNQVFVSGTCPYAGAAMFTVTDGATADPTLDNCSQQLSGCRARYGSVNELPTAAFPSVGRTR